MRPKIEPPEEVASSPAWPGQRSVRGTPAMTWSTCWPHPAQVVLPQVRQETGRHMRVSFKGCGEVRVVLG